MTPTAHIRWAKRADAAHIVRLIKALALYENEPASSVKITEADILQDGFGGADNDIHNQPSGLSRPRRFECLIAGLSNQPVGFCLFFHNYSTWEGRAGLYVEDIFVEEAARGHGLGKMLMATLASVAQARDCPRIDLSVLDWNPARTDLMASLSHPARFNPTILRPACSARSPWAMVKGRTSRVTIAPPARNA